MKVLFVASGNSRFYDIAPFIKSQGEALLEEGVEVSYFSVRGKGAMHYIHNALQLRKFLKKNDFDLIHAHYSLCGWVAVLAWPGLPVVLSLMGDDARGSFISREQRSFRSRLLLLLTRSVQPFVDAIIYKAPNMLGAIHRRKIAYLVPNGVRLDQFQLMGEENRRSLGMRPDKKYVLFLGNPKDLNKNIALVRQAIGLLNRPDVELVNIFDADHDTVVKYMNAADVFTLCSFSEGSPNVVKEAMTCNCPVVATDVGDVAWVLGDTPGCFVSDHNPENFARQLSGALAFSESAGRTQGRKRILELGLDSVSIAQKLNGIYRDTLGGPPGNRVRAGTTAPQIGGQLQAVD